MGIKIQRDFYCPRGKENKAYNVLFILGKRPPTNPTGPAFLFLQDSINRKVSENGVQRATASARRRFFPPDSACEPNGRIFATRQKSRGFLRRQAEKGQASSVASVGICEKD